MRVERDRGGRVRFPGRRVVSVLLVAAMFAPGCSTTRRDLATPGGRLVAPGPPSVAPPLLKAHLRDGRLAIFERWTILPDARAGVPPVDTLAGDAELFDAARNALGVRALRLPADEVVLLETNRTDVSLGRTFGAVLIGVGVVVVGMAAAVLIACAANPKCFGSCPTFYAWDGERWSLMAEGFSASIAPRLEATDVDALWRARPRGRTVEIVMRNEALETHVVRSVRLLAAPRGEGRVARATDGSFRRVMRPLAPRRALAPEGDVAALIAAADGRERTSPADSADLGARERILLDFGDAHGAGLGLVVTHRQTLVMTYLLYQALAWMGADAGAHLAGLERGDPRWLRFAWEAGRGLGPIEVQVREPGGPWRVAGAVDETGPIASDRHLVPLPELPAGSEIALHLARGHWRLDEVALVEIGERIEPIAVEPALARRDSTGGADVRAAALAGAPLVTMPGQSVHYRFDLPDPAERYELFLESRGYYLEWIREPWLREGDPAMLAGLLDDPRGALRRLAPAFKRQEADFERAFWGSRAAHP